MRVLKSLATPPFPQGVIIETLSEGDSLLTSHFGKRGLLGGAPGGVDGIADGTNV